MKSVLKEYQDKHSYNSTVNKKKLSLFEVLRIIAYSIIAIIIIYVVFKDKNAYQTKSQPTKDILKHKESMSNYV